MKPCSRNRKLIVCLALDELDNRQARDLRAHLENCDGCARYLAEISSVTEKLTAPEQASDIRASESFHRSVMSRLRAEESGSAWETLAAYLREIAMQRRLVLSVAAVVAILIAALSFYEQRPGVSPHTQSSARAVSAADVKTDMPPTVANYQMVANQSLDKLDELLTTQGSRNPSPARVYTVASVLD